MKVWWKGHSKTINTAAIIAVLGVVEINFHYLQDLLGQYYGISFVVFSALMAYLRKVTKEPLS